MKQFVIEYLHGYDENERMVYSCLVSKKDFQGAKKFAKENFEAVADMTDCLSYEEDNEVPIENALSFKITPLKVFIKRLKDDCRFLKTCQKEIIERAVLD